MAKRKKAQPWDAVFDRLRCIWRPDKVYPPKMTAVELDALEEELGFKFPFSYRAFAERFGLGGNLKVAPAFGISVTILAGWRPRESSGDAVETLLERTLDCRPLGTLLYRRSAPHPSPLCGAQHEVPRGAKATTEFRDIVAFAGDDDEGVGTFLFQPPEVTDAKLHEYQVYVLNIAGVLRPVANSFWKWLEWVERSYQFEPTVEYEDEADRGPKPVTVAKPDPQRAVIQYERSSIRDKNAPEKKYVEAWLAFNNHTARDLALSIRDRGQTDAFPILADALEEAGCANADLLDSCRKGDPDIDGQWVLQVLLGKA